MSSADAEVAVIGGGVVGAAVAHVLTRRGVETILLEAEDELGLAASGTNSGILHTGFDSTPGELETRLILRAARLRPPVLRELGVPVLECGALMPGRGLEANALRARENGVDVLLDDEGLHVPGESVTDPVAYTLALAASVEVQTGAGVEKIERGASPSAGGGLALSLAGGGGVRCRVAVNCAGLHADAVARMAGDDSFAIYPRKGEFFVFEAPGGRPLERILLPVPTKRTKGVLVFPTVDGKVIAGPTAHDLEDKGDWSVRPEAAGEVLPKARELLPELEGEEPIASYAGLRPAGRDGANYAIFASTACPGLVNVAAIRSTGLTASLGIAEHVAGLVAEQGVELGPERPMAGEAAASPVGPWWRRTADRFARAA